MDSITSIDKYMGNVDLGLYKKFCVLNKIKGVEGFSGGEPWMKYPFLDHSLTMYTYDGDILLVTNPYLDDNECREYLRIYGLQGAVFGKENSFYNPGGTNLVVVVLGKWY